MWIGLGQGMVVGLMLGAGFAFWQIVELIGGVL